MTKSIKFNDNGRVETIYNGKKDGNEWTQIDDANFPTVTEDNVSKTYWYDGDSVTVETEPSSGYDEI